MGKVPWEEHPGNAGASSVVFFVFSGPIDPLFQVFKISRPLPQATSPFPSCQEATLHNFWAFPLDHSVNCANGGPAHCAT